MIKFGTGGWRGVIVDDFTAEGLWLVARAICRCITSIPRLWPEAIGGLQVTDVETIDGLKLHREDGSWVMLRVSGTEAVVRVYAEAASQEDVEELVREGEKLIDAAAAR